MERPSSPSSSVITAPLHDENNIRRLARLVTQAMLGPFALLHYDARSQTMVDWAWPTDDQNNMLSPDQFHNYRQERDFRYPCCLCADGMYSTKETQQNYVESVVYPWWNEISETWIWKVRCAADSCTYQVKIDRYFQLRTQNTQAYPLRGMTDCLPTSLMQMWSHEEQGVLFSRLGSFTSGGIRGEEFLMLFQACMLCERVGTKRSMRFHRCAKIVL
ncbi:hypothetical protein P692DRAFT_20761204 [Suillus brevipes Sb2]|nr:hypothetical protein P692DRAFT_20761204 [Suillus brevipes Sb2]